MKNAGNILLYRKPNKSISDTTVGGIGGLRVIPQGVTVKKMRQDGAFLNARGAVAPMDKIVYEGKARVPILLWGGGLPLRAEKFSPFKLYKVSPSWANTFDAFKPWAPISLISEGQKSRCWISRHPGVENGVIITGPCSSCLDIAWYFCERGLLPIFHSVLSVQQWAGRGQLGRRWYSPAGNLYGAWHLPIPENGCLRLRSELISLVVGYIAVKMLMKLGISAQLKWPNDLIIDRKKVGGILIERRGGFLIAGIGINLILSPGRDCLRESQALSTTCLKEHGVKINPMELWLELTQYGRSLYEKIIHLETPLEIVSIIQNHMAFMGETVEICNGASRPFQAQLLGLDSSGYLRVGTSQSERLIRSGTIYPLKREKEVEK